MIEKFFELFKSDAVQKISVVSSLCAQIIRTLEQEGAKIPEGKNVLLDTLIDILQKHKNENSAI